MTDPIRVGGGAPPEKLLYTPAEAARMLGISRSGLYVLLGDGTIPSVRIGTSRRIRYRELAAYAEGLAAAPTSQAERRIERTRSHTVPGEAAINTSSGREERH